MAACTSKLMRAASELAFRYDGLGRVQRKRLSKFSALQQLSQAFLPGAGAAYLQGFMHQYRQELADTESIPDF